MKALQSALGSLFLVALAVPQAARADFVFASDVYNFAVLYEGTGGHNLQITNVTVNGNIGVGGTGAVQFNGPGTINGSVEFVAANTGQFHNNNGANVGPTGITYNNMPHDVAGDLTSLNSRSTTLGGEAGTALSLMNGNRTVNGSAGTIDANGNEVFTVNSFSDVNGDLLTINGDGHNIVFNFATNTNFNGSVALGGGLTPDQVLFNFTGSGNAVSVNNNGNPTPWQGIILDPSGAVSVVHANLNGRIFGGDSQDMQIVSGDTITAPPAPTPEPSFIGLLSAGVLGLIGVHVVRSDRARALRS